MSLAKRIVEGAVDGIGESGPPVRADEGTRVWAALRVKVWVELRVMPGGLLLVRFHAQVLLGFVGASLLEPR